MLSAEQAMLDNPLLDAFNQTMATGGDAEVRRTQLIAGHGFAIPTNQAIDAIMRCSPTGIVEIGAGTGYWAHLLQQRGIDVAAFDIEPAPSRQNRWFAGARPWHAVHYGDGEVAGQHPDRTLLIIWPTKNEIWAADAIELYHSAGGTCVIYVGEEPGGRTGDNVFHALLGELTVCAQCEYRSTASPCICSVETRWCRTETIALPHWPGYHDNLHIYARRAIGQRSQRRRRWPRSHGPQID